MAAKTVEIRGFLDLDSQLRRQYGAPPLYLEITEGISGRELAKLINIDPDLVEVIFINGFVHDLEAVIHGGDRVAFLPPGCPGPYRIALGFYGKNQGNPRNFSLSEGKDKA